MDVLLVSHFHWDREWYRPFEEFRGRLVDAIDRVLDLLDEDPGYRFLLDGQAIVVEDYLAIRPERRAALERGVQSGRLGLGPWYVQPDSLLPSGESHVRNLLIGRAVASDFGPVSEIAYVPDSFGHPAQFPQLFAGFGLRLFVYWRGNGDEIDSLGASWRWVAPEGSAIEARFLVGGYFDAACLPDDAEAAAAGLAELARSRAESEPVLLMNGFDHMLPSAGAGAAAERLATLAGMRVRRGLLDDLPRPGDSAAERPLPQHCGELRGARIANLLPGVWSARLPLKLANRRCETVLDGWLEPWAALGRRLSTPDERPALALAWRALLANQAHDSIGGCSVDAVHERMRARFDDAERLAHATLSRLLERLAGRGVERRVPWSQEQELVVFNPSPHPRSDVVRVALDPYPPLALPLGRPDIPPLALTGADPPGFAIDGEPVRVAATGDPGRVSFLPNNRPCDVEFVARDVPAFGCRRYRLTSCAPSPDEVDDGRWIATEDASVEVADDGTLAVTFVGDGGGTGDRRFAGLLSLEDRGDRGDSYDFDPIEDDAPLERVRVAVRRRRHGSGLQAIEVTRVVRVPAALDQSRSRRASATVELVLHAEARLAPHVPRVDLSVRLRNTARDHRLRLLFPTGAPLRAFHAATTFDVAARTVDRPDDSRWLHRAPATFPHQGWISANGLTLVAPGLPEAEVTPHGTIALTLLRAVGWLARYDLHSRPVPAGPAMEVEGGQCLGEVEARLALFCGTRDRDATCARDAELGLAGVIGGNEPLLAAGQPLVELEPAALVLSALKPAERGNAIVLRVLNPTDAPLEARLRLGFPFARATPVRLDEGPTESPIAVDSRTVRLPVPAHALRTIAIE